MTTSLIDFCKEFPSVAEDVLAEQKLLTAAILIVSEFVGDNVDPKSEIVVAVYNRLSSARSGERFGQMMTTVLPMVTDLVKLMPTIFDIIKANDPRHTAH